MHLFCKQCIFIYIKTDMDFQWNLFSNIQYTHPNFLIYFHIRIANDNKKKNKKI